MSYCDDQVFVCGGMDNGQNLLTEFRVMTLPSGNWLELRMKNKKDTGMMTRNNSLDNIGAVDIVLPETERTQAPRHVSPTNGVAPKDTKPKGKLMRRSHHTLCTFKSKTEKLRQGYKMDYFTSFIFGGLI